MQRPKQLAGGQERADEVKDMAGNTYCEEGMVDGAEDPGGKAIEKKG